VCVCLSVVCVCVSVVCVCVSECGVCVSECGVCVCVSECDREASIMRGSWPTRGCRPGGGGYEKPSFNPT